MANKKENNSRWTTDGAEKMALTMLKRGESMELCARYEAPPGVSGNKGTYEPPPGISGNTGTYEAPPGVSGNKGTSSKNYWEQGKKRKIRLGTWEQKLCL